MTNNADYLCKCVWVIWISFFVKGLFNQGFCPFINMFSGVFFLLMYKSSEYDSLPDICVTNIFSYSVACSLTGIF